jgi:long-chain fatty acid transport protein
MKKPLLLCCTLLMVMWPALALATNGDALIGVGPISRAMGGVGIAAPQDAISAVFSNPAAMCFSDFCPSSQVDFAGTAFMPQTHTTITAGNQTFEARSKTKVYPIPALGISFNFKELPNWRFGFGAYGVSGQGVDYRETSVDRPNHFFPGVPLAAGIRTELQLMKFAPTVAYMPYPWLSFGASLHVNYSNLDLGSGSGSGFGAGAQIGAIVKPHPKISLGLTYTTPQDTTYDNVTDFDGDGRLDNLKLGSPHRLGFGVAYEPFLGKLLLEADVKWLNWSGATGYGDFGWRDQVVFGVGAQYKPIPKLALRLGYNYGRNPVKEHDNFNGLFGQFTNVQGKPVPSYYFETFRVTGFPAIVEHHFTFGVGYQVTEKFIVNIAYMHAFENTITERGTNLFGQPTRISSRLSEDSIDVGFSIRF